MRHKHADLIHAWAEGAEIECFDDESGEWCGYSGSSKPGWLLDHKYRIKPTPKPDVVWFMAVSQRNAGLEIWRRQQRILSDNLRLTFDGETGKLKSAEVL